MSTDKMRERFEEYARARSWTLTKDSIGIYENLEVQYAWTAYQAAYAQGQRDLIEAMGEPVAWKVSIPGSPELGYWIGSDRSEPLHNVPLYRLPEGMQK